MPKYLLEIAYDGTDYHGWQVQPNGITVQETLQCAMRNLYGYSPDITGCSRTDAGVHANSFYCHFILNNDISGSAVVAGLNSVLKDNIRALSCKVVADDFHCRYNAIGKNYIYRVDRRKIIDPFNARYSYNYSGKLNIEYINEFCDSVVGKHDFKGFSSSGTSVKDTIRNVSEFSVKEDGDFLVFSITANGFLYNMVRILVGTALEVGKGRLDIDIASKIFASGDRSLGGATAPAKALFLNKVYY